MILLKDFFLASFDDIVGRSVSLKRMLGSAVYLVFKQGVLVQRFCSSCHWILISLSLFGSNNSLPKVNGKISGNISLIR